MEKQQKQQGTQRVMVTLTASQVAQLDAACSETGASRSQPIAIALYEWLARTGASPSVRRDD